MFRPALTGLAAPAHGPQRSMTTERSKDEHAIYSDTNSERNSASLL